MLTNVSDITGMRHLSMLSRRGPRSTLSDASRLRAPAGPPPLRQAPAHGWQRLMFWLLAPAPGEAAPPVNRLPAVRQDFLACLADVSGETAGTLRERIAAAHSLRELWHLRAEVYRVVALAHSQALAGERVDALSRHFPTRTPRSAFAPLGG
jgi:hypothetical protein